MRVNRTVRIEIGALLSAGMLLTVLGSTAAADPSFDGDAADDEVTLSAREARVAEEVWEASATDPAVRLVEYLRADLCGVSSGDLSTQANGDCASNMSAVQVPDCEGATAVMPLWRRDRATPTQEWGPWRFVTGWSCPTDTLPTLTLEDFRRLPLAPPVLHIQPANGHVLVNLPTITLTDPTPQNLTTTLLGYPLDVHATATTYTWDYGDTTEPLVTTSPGHPWPDHDITHTYRAPGTYQITLTTTWSGTYRLTGTTTWHTITGTATTRTTSTPITATELHPHLVTDTCTTTPHAPGC